MSGLPIHKRPFHAFLSHAHANRACVERIQQWLTAADIPVWFDAHHLPASSKIATELAGAIEQCRATIIVLSQASVASGWVQEEYEASMAQRTAFREFRIIPIRIDDCKVPGFLQSTKWVDAVDGKLNVHNAEDVLTSLYHPPGSPTWTGIRDVYVCHPWRPNEARVKDLVCGALVRSGFRLIGDAKDQQGFAEGRRVESILDSCGAFVGILPDRGGGNTGEQMLREVELASGRSMPRLLVAQSTVNLPEKFGPVAVSWSSEASSGLGPELAPAIESLHEEWRQPARPHYVFFGTNFDEQHAARKEAIVRLVERVTAMPCVIGDHIREGQIQEIITSRIRGAFLMIADISEENLNTCIEAGAARGAGTRLFLVSGPPRRKPPFLFRDHQVWHYDDDVDLLAKIHRIAYPFRRRVLNEEPGIVAAAASASAT